MDEYDEKDLSEINLRYLLELFFNKYKNEGNSINDKTLISAAVRVSLKYLAKNIPGKTLELRVPPYSAVQLLPGIIHRRGNPPNVIETDPVSWLKIAVGIVSIDEIEEEGLITISGSDANKLENYLPLVRFS